VLQCMREGPVAYVVEERGGEGSRLFLRGDWGPFLRKAREGVLHQSHGPERVIETGVLGTGKDKVPHAELTNAAKPLDLRGLDEVHDQILGDGNEPVDRVREEFEALIR